MTKQPSLKTILLDYINNTSGWVSKGILALEAEKEGFLGETAGRVLRSLVEENLIQVSYYKSKRNIELARYARISEPMPKVEVKKVVVEMVNGIPLAFYA